MPNEGTNVIFPESKLAHEPLDGLEGIEIGPAAHDPFGLHTHNVGLSPERDPIDYEFLKQSQLEHCGRVAPIHIAADAADIPLPDGSTDSVLHSHVWEHFPNPLAALEEWVRVTRAGGYIFVIVSKRDAALSDRDRPLTSLASLLQSPNEKAGAESPDALRGMSRGHFTVLSPGLLREIAHWFNHSHFRARLEEVAFAETDDKVGNGHTIA